MEKYEFEKQKEPVTVHVMNSNINIREVEIGWFKNFIAKLFSIPVEKMCYCDITCRVSNSYDSKIHKIGDFYSANGNTVRLMSIGSYDAIANQFVFSTSEISVLEANKLKNIRQLHLSFSTFTEKQ